MTRRGLDDSILRRPEAAAKWSVIEVVQHLADSDLVFSYRLKMMLTEARPPLLGYEPPSPQTVPDPAGGGEDSTASGGRKVPAFC